MGVDQIRFDSAFKFSKQDFLIDNGNLSNQDKEMQKAYNCWSDNFFRYNV